MMHKHNTSAKVICQAIIFILILCTPRNAVTFDCGDGTSIPPFIGSGVDPNLLLIIDSSGSMYDLAYDDLDEPDFCNDDSYIPSTYLSWDNGVAYSSGEIIEDNGTLYKAINDVAAGGASPSTDGLTNWRPAFESYANSTAYLEGDIVSDNSTGTTLWYRATANGTSNNADISADTGVDWSTVPTSYAGYFDNDTWYLWTALSTTKFTALAAAPTCSNAAYIADEYYSNNDICVALSNSDATFIAMAAKGNLLNWAASSKFDIEKEILTGGKYDAASQSLVKESRGCIGRRMVKQVRVEDSSGNQKHISFSISSDYDIETATNAETKIELFKPTDGGFQFANEACEAAITASSFGQVQNLSEDCLELGAQHESVENSNAAFNHGFQTCWGYPTVGTGDITRMITACSHIYDNNVNPYDLDTNDSGYVCIGDYDGDGNGVDDGSGYIGRCINVTTPGTPGTAGTCTDDTDTPGATYTHPYGGTDDKILCGNDASLPYGSGTQTCTPGQVYTCPTSYAWNNGKNACAHGSTRMYWVKSETCVGGTAGTAIAYSWIANHDDDLTDAGLYPIPDPYPTTDGCVEMAIREYCQDFYAPPVIDPSTEPVLGDNATTHFPNLPAILVDVATSAQLGETIETMYARAEVASQPTGLIQNPEYSNIRFGLMSFNYDGADWECDNLASPNQLYDCDSTTKDGASISPQAYLHSSPDHADDLAEMVNDLKARAWTPMAETMYNALGYYGQSTTMRLDDTDFSISAAGAYGGDAVDSDNNAIAVWTNARVTTKGTIVSSGGELYWASDDGTTNGTSALDDAGVPWVPVDPVTAYCQSNNILILSDGAPTADLNDLVSTFTATNNDGGSDDIADCGDYDGSTYLDDLAYFGATSSTLFAEENFVPEFGNNATKQNIHTYVVTTGALRTDGTENECRADVLLKSAAANGDPEGNTTTYFNGENPEDLQESLEDIFAEISSRASSGSAASVISSSRSGEGAVYQAIFWPRTDRVGVDANSDGEDEDLLWTGEVHALFVDSQGYMYEDSNGNRQMDNNGADKRVITFFNDALNKTQACYTDLVNDSCPAGSTVEITDINYLWSANEWLAKVGLLGYATNDSNDIFKNRANYISSDRQRYIITWNDLDNDGIVDNSEVLDFADRQPADAAETTDWANMAVSGGRGAVNFDFNAADTATTNQIVRWVRGYDEPGMRDRSISIDLNHDGFATDAITWRLGDIIHSTPMPVSSPMEYYHFLYSDSSYNNFINTYKNRRHVIYYGGNDGMFHAVNGGFFDDDSNKFCLTADCTDSGTPPELGAELWAYVPYNLLPHLQCMTDVEYSHKYYVDQRPRIYDVRIWPESDTTHINGWGTILVASMRLGGYPTLASDLNGDAGDLRQFTSAYIIFDITNPEVPPTVLGEFTRTTAGTEVDLGFTTPITSMVVMKSASADPSNTLTSDYKWYLIMGSGPHGANAMKGESDQLPKIGVLPLEWLGQNGETKRPFRIPATDPNTVGNNEGGSFTLGAAPDFGFVSDLVTVDFDLEDNYKSDAVYFGTVEGSFGTSWKGKMYRLVTKDTSGADVTTLPSDWGNLLSPISKPNPAILHDAEQPIVAPASVGKDDIGNFWVYFGTGRFYDGDDKGDSSTQSFYGIKEPVDCSTDELTWDTVEKAGSYNLDPGLQGMKQVDQILVSQTATLSPYDAALSCRDSSTNCRLDQNGDPILTIGALEDYIEGSTCSEGRDGWYREFLNDRERNLGQATLMGGLTVFTTYQPYEDVCQAEGYSYLYALYYKTGTPWGKLVFSDETLPTDPLPDSISLGRGLALTPNLHLGQDSVGPTTFIQTSTGEIIEIPQVNLPINNYRTGRTKWQEGLCP